MRKHSKTAALLGLLLVVLIGGQALAQDRIVGKALYDKLRREARTLVKMEGQPGLAWTPDGKASYISEDGTFKRVDILTGE